MELLWEEMSEVQKVLARLIVDTHNIATVFLNPFTLLVFTCLQEYPV